MHTLTYILTFAHNIDTHTHTQPSSHFHSRMRDRVGKVKKALHCVRNLKHVSSIISEYSLILIIFRKEKRNVISFSAFLKYSHPFFFPCSLRHVSTSLFFRSSLLFLHSHSLHSFTFIFLALSNSSYF